MAHIYKKIKTICDNCGEELQNSFIILLCNDTGITSDDYEIHFCDIECLKNELHEKEKRYSEEELDEMFDYYSMKKYYRRTKIKKWLKDKN